MSWGDDGGSLGEFWKGEVLKAFDRGLGSHRAASGE